MSELARENMLRLQQLIPEWKTWLLENRIAIPWALRCCTQPEDIQRKVLEECKLHLEAIPRMVKQCILCKQLIIVGDGYRSTPEGLAHGRCVKQKEQGDATESQ